MTREADSPGRTAGRRPGRPRSAAAHQAILTAALTLLAEEGFPGLSMEAVAQRAGVGKTTIYRRWRSKAELVAEALRELRQEEPPPDSGSFRGDLRELGRRQLTLMRAQPAFARLGPRLMSDSADDPELHALALESAILPMRTILEELIRRGIARGELRPDLDADIVIDVLHGSIFYQLLILGQDVSSLDESYHQRVLDQLLPGIESRG